ncbi:uncharacterized protein LOC131841425 [Achroia grisella]|uniref:uncharacterized protein LOC131841425 n=1 Tax=Achroia grisella TaxID=688607 RepID=UPI0027D2E13A|nr:uncharacterized protein LOC131841425 [Achroia grisella]
MAAFDLKTALLLLPIVNQDEKVIKSLLDGIEFYKTILRPDDHPLLINFILKSRLSSCAKLKLKSNYDNINNLTEDIRKILLPSKSYTFILTQLQKCRQGNRTILEFGDEIERLFVELTIAQAGGLNTAYDILLPINENIAIRQFAYGLNDSRLTMYIICRKISNLQEAVKTAIEEEEFIPKNFQTCLINKINYDAREFDRRTNQCQAKRNNTKSRSQQNA